MCVCTSRGTWLDATLVTLVTRVFVLVEDADGCYFGDLGDTCVCTSRETRSDVTMVTLVTLVVLV
jgi:hypothetical protein